MTELEKLKLAMVIEVQRILDAQARDWGYDNMASAVSYAEEPAVPRYQAEGRALRAWRSAVWDACYQASSDVNEGPEIPATFDVFALLPAAPERP
jgi:hypothetical protein